MYFSEIKSSKQVKFNEKITIFFTNLHPSFPTRLNIPETTLARSCPAAIMTTCVETKRPRIYEGEHSAMYKGVVIDVMPKEIDNITLPRFIQDLDTGVQTFSNHLENATYTNQTVIRHNSKLPGNISSNSVDGVQQTY